MNKFLRYKDLCKELDHYPNASELIYKYGFTRLELTSIYTAKLDDKDYLLLPLKNEDGTPLHYFNNDRIMLKFFGSHELMRNSPINTFADYRDSELINGFIFSEIESSLAIEGVRSTRAQIEKLATTQYEELTETNDIIIKNMLLAYDFVKGNPINARNIYALYNILSKKCLNEKEMLLPGNLYRHDAVNIVDASQNIVDKGVDFTKLPKLMDELIAYINLEKTYEVHLIASHIIHFYMIYLHPYFNYNGRMARVLSFWYNYHFAPSLSLLLVSEAINNKAHKNGYYNAIMNSRRAQNDLTFFLEYMGDIILKYTKVYINFYTVINALKSSGELLTRASEVALKYVLAISPQGEGYFDWKEYRDFTNGTFSKQYYLRLLNNLVAVNVLVVKDHKKANLYRLNIVELERFGYLA